MSWVKKRGQGAPSPAPGAPPVQMYNPNQPPQWPQQGNNWYGQANQSNNYWQQNPQYQYQDPNTLYSNTGYPQQPQPQPPQQAYGNVQYSQYNQNNYPNPPQEEVPEGDGWSSNWGWGDEDNNIQQNNLTESFANDESWNWASEEKSKPEEPVKTHPSIDRITGRRGKLETPQWSVESQVSQESSDDVLQTSESDKSRMLSRSSTISHSPISGQELPPGDEVREEQAQVENREIVQGVKNATPSPPVNTQGAVGAPPLGSDDKGSSNNPYKRGTGPSHKSANNFRTSNITPPDPRPQSAFQPPNFHPQSVNLETLPDNSEQPDNLPQPSGFSARKISPTASQQWSTENNEAPINDRNQYLETGQLSDVDNYHQTRDVPNLDDALPPPGLRRIVPGQQETPTTQPEPPEGLRRMIPGESSSPEAVSRQRDSEPEFNEVRSATIGADTPPTTNQTINQRRDSVEGQIQEEIVNAVMNLTVEDEAKSDKRQSSDSEARGKSPRRYKEDRDRDRNRGRYTPDDYRDRKYERRRYKDRRYEEDTDYYSDKERDRRHRDDREYDRKYSSLRKEKDKDKDKERKRREYGRDPRKGEYYYGRFEEDFETESRSRASSRSDSMHDTYRDRDRGHHDRDRRDRRPKERHRRHHRDPYSQGFGYDMYSQYYQQYQYYENLRKTNPQAYAQLYRKYYQGEAPPYGDDRASVHSGRSSANEEMVKDSFARPFDQTDATLNYDAQRMTPAKFATAHVKASISSGKMVKVLPHYPLDGQTANVELCSLETFLHVDEEYQELKRFPGPLVKGVTHKKTIIEYCESKIRGASYSVEIGDVESYVLMWELLILLIRQNGMVVGTDIAELLLKNRRQEAPRPASVVSNSNSAGGEGSSDTNHAHMEVTPKEEEVTDKFREYLLYGSGKEALEWAMKHGLWGHALFLASKLDKRTYANVMMRFANGLTMNDPLQTLYQLLSGRVPAAVTCVADEKWGDWRPHLAMILSNSTQRPEINCRAITVLGDTLLGRGSLFAAQFCYLMAETGFGDYGNADSKVVLLGSDQSRPFLHFATNEAIHMTEIYEYACSLNDDNFALVTFQRYKYIMATRLADVGLLERSLAYLEQIANFIIKNPSAVESKLIDEVAILGDRLKYYDPVGDGDEDGAFGVDLDTSRPDNSWLKDLRKVQSDHNAQTIGYVPTNHQEEDVGQQVYDRDVWQQQQLEEYQQQYQAEPTQVEYQQQAATGDQQIDGYSNQYWGGPQQQQQWNPEPNSYQPETVEHQEPTYYGSVAQTEDMPKPQITLPNQQRGERKKSEGESPREEGRKQATPKSEVGQKGKQAGNGWFGGIFNKLTLKPKNQMRLPDDKNPSIVWDPDKKRWVNTDGDGGDVANDFKPPPKMGDLAPRSQTFNQIQPISSPQLETKPPLPNMFKLQKNRNLKKSYIDVFNPNGNAGGQQPPPGPLGGIAQISAAPQMNFFVPPPVNDPNAPTDFLTPAPPLQYDEHAQKRGSNKRT